MKPGEKQSPASLRKFGVTLAVLFVIFGEGVPYLKRHHGYTWPWVVAAILMGLALLKPLMLKPLQHFWGLLGEVLGAINIRIVLGLFFFIFMVPFGILHRRFGRDPMRRNYEPEEASYRIKRGQDINKDQMGKIY